MGTHVFFSKNPATIRDRELYGWGDFNPYTGIYWSPLVVCSRSPGFPGVPRDTSWCGFVARRLPRSTSPVWYRGICGLLRRERTDGTRSSGSGWPRGRTPSQPRPFSVPCLCHRAPPETQGSRKHRVLEILRDNSLGTCKGVWDGKVWDKLSVEDSHVGNNPYTGIRYSLILSHNHGCLWCPGMYPPEPLDWVSWSTR